ncbi:hypothetical protein SAMN04487925_103767 [Bradyrhizobium sp. cf659]|nr:hypothetical protein SAMN04487925_103767 [Bradyrhizobium sp. cf659]
MPIDLDEDYSTYCCVLPAERLARCRPGRPSTVFYTTSTKETDRCLTTTRA